MRLIIGMSGASGVIYGIRLLEVLQQAPDIETHLVISDSSKLNIALETEWSASDVKTLADHVHSDKDISANIASGSFKTVGMRDGDPWPVRGGKGAKPMLSQSVPVKLKRSYLHRLNDESCDDCFCRQTGTHQRDSVGLFP